MKFKCARLAMKYAIIWQQTLLHILFFGNFFSRYPKMCTTLKKEGNLTGGDNCRGWTSCEEWCLSTSDLSCHHVWAAVRDLGTTIWWNGCDFREEGSFVNHTCNTLEDVESWNCKLYKDEKGTVARGRVSDQRKTKVPF